MKYFKEMIGILTPKERMQIREGLELQSTPCRRLELFELIDAGAVDDDEAAANYLYGDRSGSAYSHLKARLRTSMIDILFPPYFPQSAGDYYELRSECWRELQIAQFFLAREAFGIARKHLEDARSMAESSGLVSEMLIIEDLCMQHFPLQSTRATRKPSREGINSRTDLLRSRLEAKQQYNKLFQMDLFQNFSAAPLTPGMEMALQAVRERREKTPFPRVQYWYCHLVILFEKMQGNFTEALEVADDLWELTRRHTPRFSRTETLEASLAYAKMAAYNGHWSRAGEVTQQILEEAPAGSWVELNALEIAFLLRFYTGDFAEAEAFQRAGSAHPKNQSSAFHAALWNYYHSYLAFAAGNYPEALGLLAASGELTRHKSKWLIGHKVAEIFNLIALRNFDLVEYKLNAFKQLLKRQKANRIDRGKHIAQVFTRLMRNDYDFEVTRQEFSHNQLIREKSEGQPGWEPFNFEVLQIDRFLEMDEVF
ncbi:MAG: hypothetical protein AAGN35_01710 [Bacteroidota bacterium]